MNTLPVHIRGLDLASPALKNPVIRPFSHTVDALVDEPAVSRTHKRESGIEVKKGIVGVAIRAFSYLNTLYHEKFPLTFQRRVKYLNKAFSKTGQLVGALHKGFSPLFTIVQNTAIAGDNFFSNFKKIVPLAKKSYVFSAFSIPYYLTRAVIDLSGSVVCGINGNREEMGEKGLLLVDHATGLSAATRSFLCGLNAFGVVSDLMLTTASTYLLGIGAILSLGDICMHAKRIYDCFQLSKKFFRQDDLKSIVKEVNSRGDNELVRKLGVSDGAKFKARMQAIYKRHSKDEKVVTKVKKALKDRISMKKLSHAVKIVALVVSIAASVVLLCSPAAPAGFILLAASAAIGLSIVGFDLITEERLSSVLRNFAPRTCPEMQVYQLRKKLKNDVSFQYWQPKYKEAATL